MSGKVKDYGGYDYQFVYSPPDRVYCVICQFPSRDPHLTLCCGHVFCKSCLDQVKTKKSGTDGCSMCRDKSFVTFPNKQVDREVKNLNVYCTNKERGCRWSGKLNSIHDHLTHRDGCKFEIVECPNRCGKALQRRSLPNHLKNNCLYRIVVCEYCHVGHFANVAHLTECPKVSLPCPNGCKIRGKVVDILREEMDDHLEECPLEVVECEYREMGCESEFPRKDQSRHNKQNAENHLALTQQNLSKTNEKLASALDRITSLEVYLYQSIHRDGKNLIADEARWFIHLEALSATSIAGNQKLPVIMKIFPRDHRYAFVYTSSFYTHDEGYKMQLLVYPRGSNGGSHLSVFFCLMSAGPFDYRLEWPLKKAFQIVLMNQIVDDHHHYVTVKFDDATPSHCGNKVAQGKQSGGWGARNFINFDELYKTTPTCQYFKNDFAFLKVVSLL